MPKRKEGEKPLPKGQDAIITIELSTNDGTTTRHFKVPGFVGNTLPWQRTGKGMDDTLLTFLQQTFGGQVTQA